jgi:hypothetical protein
MHTTFGRPAQHHSLCDPRSLCRPSANNFRCGPGCQMDDVLMPPLTLPSIAHRFPNLTKIVFQNWDDSVCFIGNITDVPASLTEIIFENTCLTDLTPVLRDGQNLYLIRMRANQIPLTISVPFPESLSMVQFVDTVIDDVMEFGKRLGQLVCYRCTTSRIYGLECSVTFSDCTTPYDNQLLQDAPSEEVVLSHISEVNALYRYRQIGAIRSRTRNAYDHRDEPIVSALFLASNVPRRMLEFVAPELYYPPPPQEEDIGEDDDEYHEEDDELHWHYNH